MKIRFVRTGGFAGLRLQTTVDTDALPPARASEILQLMRSAGVLDSQPAAPRRQGLPDQFEYHLSVESHTWGTRDLVLAESDVTEDMKPLLDHLTDLALHKVDPPAADGSG